VPLVRGRLFDSRDTAQSRGVVIVNETFARRYLPGQDPVGKILVSRATSIGPLGASLMQNRDHEIVGVVGDTKNASLQTATEPAIYHTQRQFPFRHMYIVARGADAAQVGAAIRQSIRRADAGLALAELRSMDDVVGASVERPKFLMFVMAVFAASALSLAALGIYGLLSYAVTERRQELSIRMALGARPAGLLWMVMRQGLTLAVAGSVAGLVAAFVAAQKISNLLYGVAPGDPLTLAGVGTLALSIAAVACALPAWRASRTNPLAGLRE
jgi:hypothetical protein